MKFAKNILTVFALLATTLLLAACNPCKDVNCENGTCADGLCVCNDGYEGALCDTRQSDKFTGSFNLSEYCSLNGEDAYSCEITESATQMTDIEFSNLRRSGIVVRATVSESGTEFIIPSQDFGSSTLSGNGVINSEGNQVTVHYVITTGATTETCTAALLRN